MACYLSASTMNDSASICHDKLLVILHRACSEVRKFIQIGASQRAYDLADAVEFIPELMLHWRPEYCESVRDALRSYQAKYSGSGFDYLSLLDMDEVALASCYLSVESEGNEKGTTQNVLANERDLTRRS
jgi:hypothetical protein